MKPVFLGLADVLRVHGDQIEQYGGRAGVRDPQLLQSAISMPMASWRGEWLHDDLYQMAAAYAFHIAQDHPFVDGNKRTSLACALTFLKINGVAVLDPQGQLYGMMVDVVTGSVDKSGLAQVFGSLQTE